MDDYYRSEGFWGRIDGGYMLIYGTGWAERFEIVHLSKDRLVLKLMGTSIKGDPTIMVFQKISDEVTILIHS